MRRVSHALLARPFGCLGVRDVEGPLCNLISCCLTEPATVLWFALNDMGQTRSCGDVRDWSALPPIATKERTSRQVRVVPQADDLLPQSSISSARTIRDIGTSIPNVFAVARLITSSNLVGREIGRSAGLAPLRMRSAYTAVCRNTLGRSTP